MRKSLLLMTAMAFAPFASFAEEPLALEWMYLNGVSPNGEWIAGFDPYLTEYSFLQNLVTDEVTDSFDELYEPGSGRFISDTGVAVCSNYEYDLPYYAEDGEFRMLPINYESDVMGFANAVTVDGKLIVGSIGRSAISAEYNGTLCIPVIWHRNAEGTYDMYEELPYPEFDWTNRKPQYVQLIDVNGDGTAIVAEMVSYSGTEVEPLLYTQDEDGEWVYKYLLPDLYKIDGYDLPEYPGEWEKEMPQATDFMSASEADAYATAMREYESRPKPEYKDFMTDEEWQAYLDAIDNEGFAFAPEFMTEEEWEAYLAAVDDYYAVPEPDAAEYMSESSYDEYQAAVADYWDEYSEWETKYFDFDDALMNILISSNYFIANNSSRISLSGKYAVLTKAALDFDTYEQANNPVIFNLFNETSAELEGISNVYATVVTNDGRVLGTTPADNAYAVRSIVYSPAYGEPLVYLHDAIKTSDPEVAEWMEENLLTTVSDYVYNPETDEYDIVTKEVVANGCPVASADLKTIVSYNIDEFDEEAPIKSFIFWLDNFSGVENIAASLNGKNLTVKVDRNGVININGDATSVQVYDMSGRNVFTKAAPGSMVRTGLKQGVYVVKVKGANGSTAIAKAIF